MVVKRGKFRQGLLWTENEVGSCPGPRPDEDPALLLALRLVRSPVTDTFSLVAFSPVPGRGCWRWSRSGVIIGGIPKDAAERLSRDKAIGFGGLDRRPLNDDWRSLLRTAYVDSECDWRPDQSVIPEDYYAGGL